LEEFYLKGEDLGDEEKGQVQRSRGDEKPK